MEPDLEYLPRNSPDLEETKFSVCLKDS